MIAPVIGRRSACPANRWCGRIRPPESPAYRPACRAASDPAPAPTRAGRSPCTAQAAPPAGCRARPSRDGRPARNARRARPAAAPSRRSCANEPGFSAHPRRTVSHVLAGSFERSVSSGTEDCIRNAISYCAMRVRVSGSPSFSYFSWFICRKPVEHGAPHFRRARRPGC